MSIIFGVQIFMNKNIKIYIILKTEQNSSQAHHIKRQNQNLEEKHCRFRSGGSDLQSLQNQLLFYLNVGHFGHGHFGLGRFGLDISAMDVSATENAKGGRFGQNHKLWVGVCACINV